jgi:hypothetical protein
MGSVGFYRLSKGSKAQNRLRTLVLYCRGLNSFVTSKTKNNTDRKLRNLTYLCIVHGPGTSVGIATGYGLDGPVIESR